MYVTARLLLARHLSLRMLARGFPTPSRDRISLLLTGVAGSYLYSVIMTMNNPFSTSVDLRID